MTVISTFHKSLLYSKDIRSRIAEIVHKPPLSVKSKSREVYKRDLNIGCIEPQIIPGVMYIDPQKNVVSFLSKINLLV